MTPQLIDEMSNAKIKAQCCKKIGTGVFGAEMDVALVNDGPVTIWIDTKNRE